MPITKIKKSKQGKRKKEVYIINVKKKNSNRKILVACSLLLDRLSPFEILVVTSALP